MKKKCPHCDFVAHGSDNPTGQSDSAYWINIRHINEAHPKETFLCGRRSGGLGERLMEGFRDHWSREPNGDRTCSYCGSLHEEDLFDILEHYVAGDPGYHFSTTDKRYKVYAHRPGVQNAMQGGIKFYMPHVDEKHPDFEKRKELFAKAVEKERDAWRKRMASR